MCIFPYVSKTVPENVSGSMRNLYNLEEPALNLPTLQEMLGIEILKVARWFTSSNSVVLLRWILPQLKPGVTCKTSLSYQNDFLEVIL